MIRIFIADDHAIFRQGVKLIFDEVPDMQVTGEARDGAEAFEKIFREEWDVALLDVSMPGTNVLEILAALKQHNARLPVVMLTMHDDEMLAMNFFKAGAACYMTKDCDPDLLIQAVREVAAGRKHITPALAERLLADFQSELGRPLHDRLSKREFSVMVSLASGKTVARIGQELGLSPRTISTYRRRILEKMELADNAELTRYALTNRLIF